MAQYESYTLRTTVLYVHPGAIEQNGILVLGTHRWHTSFDSHTHLALALTQAPHAEL